MYIVIFITCPNDKTANKLANLLLKERLAACINSVPIKSSYWWKGKIEKSKEVLLIIKTKEKLAGKIVKKVKENHPYAIPEIIALPIAGGYKKYLKWIRKETKKH